jgi:hypothetical protein
MQLKTTYIGVGLMKGPRQSMVRGMPLPRDSRKLAA